MTDIGPLGFPPPVSSPVRRGRSLESRRCCRWRGLSAISAGATPRAEMLNFLRGGESPIRGLKGQKCRCHRHRTRPLGVDDCGRGGPQPTPPSGGGLHPRDRQGRHRAFGGGLLGLADGAPPCFLLPRFTGEGREGEGDQPMPDYFRSAMSAASTAALPPPPSRPPPPRDDGGGRDLSGKPPSTPFAPVFDRYTNPPD